MAKGVFHLNHRVTYRSGNTYGCRCSIGEDHTSDHPEYGEQVISGEEITAEMSRVHAELTGRKEMWKAGGLFQVEEGELKKSLVEFHPDSDQDKKNVEHYKLAHTMLETMADYFEDGWYTISMQGSGEKSGAIEFTVHPTEAPPDPVEPPEDAEETQES